MTLDELCATHWAATVGHPYDQLGPESKALARKSMRAVLKAHVEPMLAEAFGAGRNSGFGSFDRQTYASRIITTLTDPRAEAANAKET